MRRAILALSGLLWCPLAIADEPPKRLTAADLSVQTHKWDGKTVQSLMHCFFADKEEYRCIIGANSGTAVRVDFQQVDPPKMKQAIEEKCDTLQKASSRACFVQATFVYLANHREEKIDGTVTMMILPVDKKAVFTSLK